MHLTTVLLNARSDWSEGVDPFSITAALTNKPVIILCRSANPKSTMLNKARLRLFNKAVGEITRLRIYTQLGSW